MKMKKLAKILILFAPLYLITTPIHAEEETLKCPPTGDAMAKRVQELLSSGYQDSSPTPLKESLTAIDHLLEEAGYCAATARAGGTSGNDRQRFIMEWHSMNQWLSRIAGFMALNIRGDFSMDWKKEYELFLEVYALPPLKP